MHVVFGLYFGLYFVRSSCTNGKSNLNDFYGVYFYGGTALLYKTIIYTYYLVYL